MSGMSFAIAMAFGLFTFFVGEWVLFEVRFEWMNEFTGPMRRILLCAVGILGALLFVAGFLTLASVIMRVAIVVIAMIW